MEQKASETNTYLFDPESPVEMARLIDLHRITTEAMGGPLSGLPDLPADAHILDLACGPGGWVLDVAYAHPDAQVAGVDISKTMIEYANARARSQNLKNASFGIMDITQPLDFADNTFDLVNARLLFGVLLRDNWKPLLRECTRILKPGGHIRLTEPVDATITTSPAHERLNTLSYLFLWKNGYGFSVDGHSVGMTTVLPRMLREAGYQQVHTLAHALEFSADCPSWKDFYHSTLAMTSMSRHLYVKSGLATAEEIEQLCQQVLLELHSSDFNAMWHMVTTLGLK
ncbi:MAG TPA: class I SAM-dependent methyltransferase [Ktedonobacteraceae bacterium]|nr:class I SAM-dependent methyltransferase [Ktedonobacteraceae bacterium]